MLCKVCIWKQVDCKNCAFKPIVIERGKEKPPLGIVPRWMHEGQRLRELRETIVRYMQHGEYLPLEWIEEYNDLIRAERAREIMKEDHDA